MKHFARVLFVRPGLQFLVIEQSVGDQSFWNLPGGKVEIGERPLRAAIREAVEEINIRGRSQRMRKLTRKQIDFDGERWVGHFFVAFGSYPAPKVMEPAKIKQLRWVTLAEARRLPAYQKAFAQILALAFDKFDIGLDWGSGQECLRPRSSFSLADQGNSLMLPL